MVAEHRSDASRLARRIVDVFVPLIMEEIVEVVKTFLQEHICERIRTQIGDVNVSQIVERVTEVAKTSSRDRTLQCTAEQILDVPVPEMVKQLFPCRRLFPRTVSNSRIQQRTVEQIVDTLAVSLAVEIIEVPVIRTEEKTQARRQRS